MKYFIIFLFIFFIVSCNNSTENKSSKQDDIISENGYDTIRAIVVKLDTGWGYDITINNKKYIHQTIIPAISGNYTFGSPENAQKTANFVAQKLLNNVFPPSVEIEELDSLGVLNDKIQITVE